MICNFCCLSRSLMRERNSWSWCIVSIKSASFEMCNVQRQGIEARWWSHFHLTNDSWSRYRLLLLFWITAQQSCNTLRWLKVSKPTKQNCIPTIPLFPYCRWDPRDFNIPEVMKEIVFGGSEVLFLLNFVSDFPFLDEDVFELPVTDIVLCVSANEAHT